MDSRGFNFLRVSSRSDEKQGRCQRVWEIWISLLSGYFFRNVKGEPDQLDMFMAIAVVSWHQTVRVFKCSIFIDLYPGDWNKIPAILDRILHCDLKGASPSWNKKILVRVKILRSCLLTIILFDFAEKNRALAYIYIWFLVFYPKCYFTDDITLFYSPMVIIVTSQPEIHVHKFYVNVNYIEGIPPVNIILNKHLLKNWTHLEMVHEVGTEWDQIGLPTWKCIIDHAHRRQDRFQIFVPWWSYGWLDVRE